MDLPVLLRDFGALHDRVKSRAASDEDLRSYHDLREQLASHILAAQRQALEPGQKPRRHVRVVRAFPVDVHVAGRMFRATTVNVSAGGFAVLMLEPPELGDRGRATLRLPGDDDPISAEVRVAHVQLRSGSARVGYAFEDLEPEDADRLELAVFDAVLEMLAR